MSKEKLNVIFNGNDYSLDMSDFLKRDQTLNITTGDFLYIGFKKPLNQFYFNITNPNVVLNTEITVEQSDISGWSAIDTVEDRTYGFSNSGFICWSQDNCNVSCEKSVINGVERFWYRLSWNQDITVTLRSIGVLFSSDDDLYIEYPILNNSKYKVAVSGNTENYLNIHIQVRDYILSDIRNTGVNKYSKDSPESCEYFKQITEFDLFNLEEVQFAARMLALSFVYYKLSDSPDDRWQIDAERYKAEYLRAFNVAFLSIDKNDDGKKDTCEQPTYKTNLRIMR